MAVPNSSRQGRPSPQLSNYLVLEYFSQQAQLFPKGRSVSDKIILRESVNWTFKSHKCMQFGCMVRDLRSKEIQVSTGQTLLHEAHGLAPPNTEPRALLR